MIAIKAFETDFFFGNGLLQGAVGFVKVAAVTKFTVAQERMEFNTAVAQLLRVDVAKAKFDIPQQTRFNLFAVTGVKSEQ